MIFLHLFPHLMMAVGVILLIIGVAQVVKETRLSSLEARVRYVEQLAAPSARRQDVDLTQLNAAEEEQHAKERHVQFTQWLQRQLSPNHWFVEMERQLARAHAPLGPAELLLISALLMLGTGCLGYWVLRVGFWLFPIGAGGFALPWVYLKFLQRRWQRKFEGSFSDALVLMANALRSGYSLFQAIEAIGRESEYPISDEFQRISQETAVGVPVEQALQSFVDRVPTMDVRIFVTAVLVQRQVGGALSEILDNIAAVIRQRVQLRGEVRAITAQQRMSGYGLVLLPVFFAVAAEFLIRSLGGSVTGSPSYLAPLLRVPWLIGVGLVMQLTGLWVIGRIVNIEI